MPTRAVWRPPRPVTRSLRPLLSARYAYRREGMKKRLRGYRPPMRFAPVVGPAPDRKFRQKLPASQNTQPELTTSLERSYGVIRHRPPSRAHQFRVLPRLGVVSP